MNTKNIFWGTLFLLGAAFFLYSQLVVTAIGFGTIVLTIFLVSIILKSIRRVSFIGMLLPAALLYLLYMAPLALPVISAWALMGAALLASAGLHLIIKHTFRHLCWDNTWEGYYES